MVAKVLLQANFLNKIKIGQILTIHVNEINQTVQGRLTRVGAMIDPISSTVPIEAEIDNTSGLLIGGMTGLADLEFTEQPPEEQP